MKYQCTNVTASCTNYISQQIAHELGNKTCLTETVCLRTEIYYVKIGFKTLFIGWLTILSFNKCLIHFF